MTSSIYVLLVVELLINQSSFCSSVGTRHKPKPEEDESGRNMAAVKSVLLSVLGLKSEPVIGGSGSRGRQAVPEYMWQLYRQQLAENRLRQRVTTGRRETDDQWKQTVDAMSTNVYGGNIIRGFIAAPHAATPSDKKRNTVNKMSSVNDSSSTASSTVRVSFNVSQSILDDVLYGAELRLFRHSTRSRQRRSVDDESPRPLQRSAARYRISVYQVIEHHPNDPVRRLLDTKVVDTGSRSRSSDDPYAATVDDEWLSLDVSPAVASWKQFGPRSNLGLDVETTTLDGRPIDVERHVRVRRSTSNRPSAAAGRRERARAGPGRPPQSNSIAPTTSTTASQPLPDGDIDARRQPLLVTYAADRRSVQRAAKRRRSAAGGKRNRKTSSGRQSACRRRQFFVDFAELEWLNNWIVAPSGYQAFMCVGACNYVLADHMNATNHAQIQSLLHSVNRSVPPPCCVPTRLSPISLLYLDEEESVVLRNYEDMVVEGCGCR